jgi:transposase
MEQRYDAMLGVIRDGFSVTEVARRFGVSRQSLRAWMARYEDGGLEALADRSHRPAISPHQMTPATESRLVELRRHHPSWGYVRLAHQLAKEGVDPVRAPSECLPRFEAPRTHPGPGTAQEALDLPAR